MGNSSPSSSSRLRKKYFQGVEKAKRDYNLRKCFLITHSSDLDWRVSVYRDLEALEVCLPDIAWTAALRRLLQGWDILRDRHWKSNTIWFDYLNTTGRTSVIASPRASMCKLERPLDFCELECKDFQEFFSMHLACPQTHAVAAIIQVFHHEFKETYEHKAISAETDVGRLLQEVHLGIELCVEAFKLYYGGINLEKLMSENFQEIEDLITEKVLANEVHDILLQAFSREDADREAKLMKQMNRYSDLSTADLGIESAFCIDTPRFEGQVEFGYGKAIRCLVELQTTTSPMQKLQYIIDTTRRICECIDDYWKLSDISREKLVINADQILSVFIYIVLQARIANLNSHLKLINEFVSKEVLIGNGGFYMATIAASLEHILTMDEGMLRKLKGLEKF